MFTEQVTVNGIEQARFKRIEGSEPRVTTSDTTLSTNNQDNLKG
jgi:hypothetical protein